VPLAGRGRARRGCWSHYPAGISTRSWRLLAVVLALVPTACAGDDDGASGNRGGGGAETSIAERTFGDPRFGLTFTYPALLRESEATRGAVGDEPLARAVLGLDQDNGILVSKYELNVAVTHENMPDVLAELNELVTKLSGMAVAGTAFDVAGFPAVRYEEFRLAEPVNGRSRLVFLFDGTTQYQLNCQWTPAKRVTLNQACDKMLSTLQRR
jgi:hypothetical protein